MENRLKEAVTSSILRIRSCTYIFRHLLTIFWLELELGQLFGFLFSRLVYFCLHLSKYWRYTHIVLRSPSRKHKDIGENKNREYVGEKQKLSCWQPHAVEFFSMPPRVRVCVCRNFHFVAPVRLPPALFLPIWRYRRFICPFAA